MDVHGPTTSKFQLSCCALFQLTAGDETSIEELKWQINKAKRESKLEWNPRDRTSGERACFVICTPHEPILKSNLKKLGFEKVFEFPRRNGYPQTGNLEMHTLNW